MRPAGASTRQRLVAWTKDDPVGAEVAIVSLQTDRLSAGGTAIGNDPEPYRLDYTLETGSQFVTTRVVVDVLGESWGRRLELRRAASGEWHVETSQYGTIDLPDPGGDASDFVDAVDTDLGFSPMFNSMPVLRHGLLEPASRAADLAMVWISVPDLALHRSLQRYTHVRAADAEPAVVLFESVGEGADFRAEIAFDADGLVLEYPGIARRMHSPD